MTHFQTKVAENIINEYIIVINYKIDMLPSEKLSNHFLARGVPLNAQRLIFDIDFEAVGENFYSGLRSIFQSKLIRLQILSIIILNEG